MTGKGRKRKNELGGQCVKGMLLMMENTMIRVLPFGLPDSGRDFFGFYMRKQRVNVHWNWPASWKRKWMMYWMDF